MEGESAESRGMIVLLVKQVHLQNDVGAILSTYSSVNDSNAIRSLFCIGHWDRIQSGRHLPEAKVNDMEERKTRTRSRR